MADEIPGLYEMAMKAGADINPQTGGPYDPLGLLGSALQYHGMFDPSGAEDRIRTANTVAANAASGGGPMPLAPWITQAPQGPAMGSEPGFGESGQPITAGAPPAYSKAGGEGSVFPGLFNPRAPSSGWFNLNDYYRGAPAQADNPAGQSVPQSFSTGSNNLSTNDWRLLPPRFRNPNYFMINGTIIDRNRAGVQLSPTGYSSYMGAGGEGAAGADTNRGSLGLGGHPRVFWNGWNARSAYPGQLGGQSQYATETY